MIPYVAAVGYGLMCVLDGVAVLEGVLDGVAVLEGVLEAEAVDVRVDVIDCVIDGDEP